MSNDNISVKKDLDLDGAVAAIDSLVEALKKKEIRVVYNTATISIKPGCHIHYKLEAKENDDQEMFLIDISWTKDIDALSLNECLNEDPGEIDREGVVDELKKLPGIGEKIAEEFWNIGIRSISDFKDADPDKFYAHYRANTESPIRNMLPIFKMVVYYASNEVHDKEVLNWKSWK